MLPRKQRGSEEARGWGHHPIIVHGHDWGSNSQAPRPDAEVYPNNNRPPAATHNSKAWSSIVLLIPKMIPGTALIVPMEEDIVGG